jgi:hypothetical protein
MSGLALHALSSWERALTGGGKAELTLGKRRDFLHDQVIHITIT